MYEGARSDIGSISEASRQRFGGGGLEAYIFPYGYYFFHRCYLSFTA